MKSIWAIADLHLSFGVPDKKMDIFGDQWMDHAQQIEKHWRALISPDDLVLIPGDISWAMRVNDARPDLEWIGQLPGTKVLLCGNHDYWWESLSKIKVILPPSCHLIQNNSFYWNGVAIGGTRLWDTPEYHFGEYIEFKENSKAKKLTESDDSEDAARIFEREFGRLQLSLKSMSAQATIKIVMSHYPPIGATLQDSRVSQLFEQNGVSICVFGHLHNVRKNIPLFGKHKGVQYTLVAADYIGFKPVKIYEI
jgi:uncharacterized protein